MDLKKIKAVLLGQGLHKNVLIRTRPAEKCLNKDKACRKMS
jgi:hypothetical protein